MPTLKLKKAPKKKIICLDFDGVIYSNPYKNNRIDNAVPPIDGFLLWFNSISNKYKVVVNSARCEDDWQIDNIASYLNNWGVDIPVCRFKPTAHYYIDDRAIRFDGDWTAIRL